MDFDKLFPLKVVLNLPSRSDRKTALDNRLSTLGVSNLSWFSAISPYNLNGDPRSFRDTARRSCALGKRSIIRIAERRNAPSVLLLEDDVVFHPEFLERTNQIHLPEDWGLFYFGCQHIETPRLVSPGVVRVTRALDTHAIAIRAQYFRAARAAMRGNGKGSRGNQCSDSLLSRIHKVIPTYAAYPNLAWQSKTYSDLRLKCYSNYNKYGEQKRFLSRIKNLRRDAQ